MRYKSGVDTYLTVLTAQTSYYAAQQTLVTARLNRLTSLVDLYRALGGGWIEKTGDAPRPVALRARKQRAPVLIATARDSVEQRIAGLDAGPTTMCSKPYDIDELLARVRAHLRRASGRAEPVYEYGNVTINPATKEVTVDGEPVILSSREWAVLEPLLARPGLILSRAQLEEKLFSWKDEVSSNAIEVYIHGLRRKLGPKLIQNVRGVGYFVPKV